MKTCSVNDCDGRLLARGMCRKHYLRWDREQHPEKWLEYSRSFNERNRELRRTQARMRYQADPQRAVAQVRRSIVKRKYGLSITEYEAIIARGCAICGADGPRMALDHCHATGKIRDALCSNCNNGLGRFVDDPARLRAAADYLEKHARE